MPDERAALLSDILDRLRGPLTSSEALRELGTACEAGRAGGLGSDAKAMAALDHATADLDPILRESVRAAVSGDLEGYTRILAMLDNVLDLAPLDGINQIYWSMLRQIFLMRMDMAPMPDFVPARLLPFYERLVREIARRLGLRPRPRAAGAPDTGRVIMVTNQFLSTQHQPSHDLIQQAVRIQERLGRTVLVLNTNMMPDRYHSPFVPPFAAAIEERLSGEQTVRFGDHAIAFLSSAEPGITASKVTLFLSAVETFDPDLVIAFGGSVMVADLLAPARPLLSIPTTSGAPLSLADIVLDYGGRTPPDGHERLARAWRPFRFSLSLRRDGESTTRAALSVPDDAFLCVVVSNRLDAEVNGEFLDLLDRLLDTVPHARVMFAGGVSILPGRLAQSRHGERLRSLGHVAGMEGLLGCCDLYLNPRRTGGGGSAAHALAVGVPILSFAAGDVASVAGPEALVDSTDAYVARAAELSGDSARLAQARNAARARFAAIEEEAGDPSQLAAYMDEAITLFRRRV